MKIPELARFATRAAQLVNFRPVVTYWLEYYILQTILQKSLHTLDDECSAYAVQLMDKLEAYKSTNSDDPTIVDDITAKAYIETFALETFAKADNQQNENKVGRQTVDTFTAAVTFLDLLAVWGPLDEKARAKSIFAKFHAVRIAKALKAGEDPNATNPVVEQPPMPLVGEQGLDDELQAIERQQQGGYRAPSMEEDDGAVPDIHGAPNLQTDHQAPTSETYNVSPVETAIQNPPPESSTSNGYFPSVPDSTTAQAGPDPPSPSQFYNTPSTPLIPPPTAPAAQPSRPAPKQVTAQPPPIPIPAPLHAVSRPPPSGDYNTDDEAVAAAQKHAKWAISALNFEDVSTAVKEFRIALAALGAT